VIDVDDNDIEEEVDPEKQLEALSALCIPDLHIFQGRQASIQYHDGRLSHFFPWLPENADHTWRRASFSSSKDKSSTANYDTMP